MLKNVNVPRSVLILCVLASCGIAKSARAQQADPAPERLTIATWNVEWFFDNDQSDHKSDIAKEQSAPSETVWQWKLNAVAGAIAKLRPTILAMQEVEDREVMLALTNELRNRHSLPYRVAFIDGFDMGTEQDVAIIYMGGLVEYARREQNKSMFESQQYYNLSKHLIARFEWLTSDGSTEELMLMTAHLRATEEAAEPRRRQARLAHQWLSKSIERGENVMLLGDFNVDSSFGNELADDDGINFLTGKYTPSPADDLVDLHKFIEPAKRKTHLILDKQFDRILVSNPLVEDKPGTQDLVFSKATTRADLVIVGSGIDEDHWDSRYTKDAKERDLSDHYPVVAEFEFK